MKYEIRDGKEMLVKVYNYDTLLCVWLALRYNNVLSPFAKVYRIEGNDVTDITVEL